MNTELESKKTINDDQEWLQKKQKSRYAMTARICNGIEDIYSVDGGDFTSYYKHNLDGLLAFINKWNTPTQRIRLERFASWSKSSSKMTNWLLLVCIAENRYVTILYDSII